MSDPKLKIDSSLDLDATQELASSYRMTQILALDSTSRTLLTSATENLIEIPTSIVFNPSRCSLDFTAVVAGTAAFTRVHQIHSMIQRISLETRNGVRLVDLPFASYYLKTITPVSTKYTDLVNRELSLSGSGKGSSVFKSNNNNGAVAEAGSNGTRMSVGGASEAPLIDYSDFQYITQDATGEPVTLYISIPFSDFKHSFMALNKNVYFGQSLNLRITWNPYTSIGFSGTDEGAYATGANTIASCAITNIRMYMASQVNSIVNDNLMNKVRTTGWSLPIDYVHSYLQSTATVTAISTQTRLNAGQGQKVKAIITAYYQGAPASSRTIYDHSNVAAAKVSTLYSQLNSRPMQDIVLNCGVANNEDFEFMRPILKNSVLAQSSDMYRFNHCWVDQWQETSLCEDENLNAGLDLDKEQLYVVNTTNPSGVYNVYTFAICKRQLVVLPGGIDVQLN